MNLSKAQRNWILLYPGVILGCGLVHVMLYSVPLTDCIIQVLYGALVAIWSLSVRHRMVDYRVRRIIAVIALLLEVYFMMQICRYKLWSEEPFLHRLSWYAYYIPQVGIPLLLFYLSLYLNTQTDEDIDRRWWLLILPGSALVLGVLTNDLHQWAFALPSEHRRFLFIAYIVWAVLLYGGALFIFIRKCRVFAARRQSWIPCLALGVGTLWLIPYILGHRPSWNGIAFWNPGEVFAFTVVGLVEGCIQIGLIPSNTGYGSLFSLIDVPISVADSQGQVVYTSAGKAPDTPHVRTQSQPIYGGTVTLSVDMSEIDRLNRQLEEVTEQINCSNEHLRWANSIQEEHSAVDARNRLYDRITELVRPHLDDIFALLDRGEENFSQTLAQIAVRNAYVKRRSNMELLREDRDALPFRELTMAVQESMEYIRLCGADGTVTFAGDGILPGALAVRAYGFFEQAAECCLDSLTMLFVKLSYRDGVLTLRMLLQADTFTLDAGTDPAPPFEQRLSLFCPLRILPWPAAKPQS